MARPSADQHGVGQYVAIQRSAQTEIRGCHVCLRQLPLRAAVSSGQERQQCLSRFGRGDKSLSHHMDTGIGQEDAPLSVHPHQGRRCAAPYQRALCQIDQDMGGLAGIAEGRIFHALFTQKPRGAHVSAGRTHRDDLAAAGSQIGCGDDPISGPQSKESGHDFPAPSHDEGAAQGISWINLTKAQGFCHNGLTNGKGENSSKLLPSGRMIRDGGENLGPEMAKQAIEFTWQERLRLMWFAAAFFFIFFKPPAMYDIC